MSEMPSFDFSNSSIKSDEELGTALEQGGRKPSKVFKPGLYDLVISAVEYEGTDEYDENWGSFAITLTGTDEKTIRGWVRVPFKDVQKKTKNGKMSPYPYKVFKDFMVALGVADEDLTLAKLGGTLKKYFSKADSLVGMNVAAQIGYNGRHLTFSGGKTQVANADGSILVDDDGQPLTFDEIEAAKEYLEQRNVSYQAFPRVLGYKPSSVGNTQAKTDADW